MPARIYDNLWLNCLTPEQHARTCDYWYTITQNHGPFTAFRTRAALDFYLDLHGLAPRGEIPEEQGTHATMKIEGCVRETGHGSLDDMPREGRRVLHLSNGDYTTGILVVDAEGPVLHYPMPMADRQVFDHRMARAHVDAGHEGPMTAMI